MKKLILILAVTSVLVLALTGVAWASHVTPPLGGYWTPYAGFTGALDETQTKTAGAGDEIPHGGYDTNTDACLQCHDVHESAGDYVLLRWRTVTDVCGSCHYLYLTGPGDTTGPGETGLQDSLSNPVLGGFMDRSTRGILGQYNTPAGPGDVTYEPGYNKYAAQAIGQGASVGSPYSAYEFSLTGVRPLGEHNLQRGPGNWQYNDDPDIFRTADYIPGSNYLLTAIKQADYPNTENVLNYTALQGLYCASCHTPHGNFGQQLFLTPSGSTTPTVLASPKILSGKPNHGRKNLPALTVNGSWLQGGGKWCAECHDKRIKGAVRNGVFIHNHPDSACLQCHNDAVNDTNAGAPPYPDFPHSGYNPNLLSNVPDALCITCHVPGSLP